MEPSVFAFGWPFHVCFARQAALELKEVVPLAALGVTAAGWFVISALQSVRDARTSRVAAMVSYTERQLEELYGPLMALLVEGEQAWRECLRSLSRDPGDSAEDLKRAGDALSVALSRRGEGAVLNAEQLKTWVFWIENAFFPRNEKIEGLITTKAHLIEGRPDDKSLPDSYCRFLEHYNTWKLRHALWEDQDIPYTWCWTIPWPESFNSDVEKSFQRLKLRHNEFLRTQREDGLGSVFQRLPDTPIVDTTTDPVVSAPRQAAIEHALGKEDTGKEASGDTTKEASSDEGERVEQTSG